MYKGAPQSPDAVCSIRVPARKDRLLVGEERLSMGLHCTLHLPEPAPHQLRSMFRMELETMHNRLDCGSTRLATKVMLSNL